MEHGGEVGKSLVACIMNYRSIINVKHWIQFQARYIQKKNVKKVASSWLKALKYLDRNVSERMRIISVTEGEGSVRRN